MTNTRTTNNEEILKNLSIVCRLSASVEAVKARSAWGRGVKAYALDLLGNLSEYVSEGWVTITGEGSTDLRTALLNGASDWAQYSEGGCALVYDEDIAERLCNPSELRKFRCSYGNPNPRESWIDCQSRALYQAFELIADKARKL